MTSQKFQDEQYSHALELSVEKLNTIIEETKPIIEKCSHLGSERESHETRIRTQREEILKFKQSTETCGKSLENAHQLLVTMQQILEEIKSKPVSGPKLILLDNTYQWKLHFASLSNSGQKYQSEPFLTSQSGYKLALSCGIFIDEQTKTAYLSVSFLILVGDFDAILSWPFHFTVTISLLDLSGAKNNISHTNRNNLEMKSLNRPAKGSVTTMPVERFLPLSVLLEKKNNYVQDDFMFLQLHIDFMEPSPMTTNSDKERSRIIQDSIQTNILSNISTN